MTTLREAAQMALDALVSAEKDAADFQRVNNDEIGDAITAIRAALAQPPCATGSQCVGGKCERCAVQEPVAWMHNFIDEVAITHRPVDLDRYPDRWTPLYKDPTPCQTCEALARSVMMDQTYHDSVMAQREWVGLTDEEMHECWDSPLTPLGMKCARAIEAKLKEKNT